MIASRSTQIGLRHWKPSSQSLDLSGTFGGMWPSMAWKARAAMDRRGHSCGELMMNTDGVTTSGQSCATESVSAVFAQLSRLARMPTATWLDIRDGAKASLASVFRPRDIANPYLLYEKLVLPVRNWEEGMAGSIVSGTWAEVLEILKGRVSYFSTVGTVNGSFGGAECEHMTDKELDHIFRPYLSQNKYKRSRATQYIQGFGCPGTNPIRDWENGDLVVPEEAVEI